MRCDLRYWVGVVGVGPTGRARCELRAGHRGECMVVEPMTRVVCRVDQESKIVPLPSAHDEALIQTAQRVSATNA